MAGLTTCVHKCLFTVCYVCKNWPSAVVPLYEEAVLFKNEAGRTKGDGRFVMNSSVNLYWLSVRSTSYLQVRQCRHNLSHGQDSRSLEYFRESVTEAFMRSNIKTSSCSTLGKRQYDLIFKFVQHFMALRISGNCWNCVSLQKSEV